MWNRRHLLGIEELSAADIDAILERAERWHALSRQSGSKKASVLEGRTVVNLFFEASTRTRTSFEIAGKRLGADVVNVSPSTSSVAKGGPALRIVQGGADDDDDKNRKPPKDKRYLN